MLKTWNCCIHTSFHGGPHLALLLRPQASSACKVSSTIQHTAWSRRLDSKLSGHCCGFQLITLMTIFYNGNNFHLQHFRIFSKMTSWPLSSYMYLCIEQAFFSLPPSIGEESAWQGFRSFQLQVLGFHAVLYRSLPVSESICSRWLGF